MCDSVKNHFFSVLLDSCADKANIDNEAMLILWCDVRASDERVHSKMNVLQPKHLTGHGLFESFLDGIQSLGIPSLEAGSCKKLVGIATDGAAAAAGFKGYVEENINWVFWTWPIA